MNMNNQIDEIFIKRMKSMRKQQLTNMLRCNICEGLFRFAHTIVDCGHTFCQVCIFNYIRGYKGRNPSIKCPQCHNPIQSNYKRSIIRDIFKQTLVDALAPQYAKQDEIIVNRVQQLFPEFDLKFLLEEFKFAPMQISNKSNKKQAQANLSVRLTQRIKQKFNISFQTFCQMITNEVSFNNFLSVLKNGPIDPKILQIKPKTQRDFKYVGINNPMKAVSLSVIKLQRFIEKKALEKVNITEEVPEQWLNTYDEKLDIRIYLEINGKQLDQKDDLEEVLKTNKGFPVIYSLTKMINNQNNVII